MDPQELLVCGGLSGKYIRRKNKFVVLFSPMTMCRANDCIVRNLGCTQVRTQGGGGGGNPPPPLDPDFYYFFACQRGWWCMMYTPTLCLDNWPKHFEPPRSSAFSGLAQNPPLEKNPAYATGCTDRQTTRKHNASDTLQGRRHNYTFFNLSLCLRWMKC